MNFAGLIFLLVAHYLSGRGLLRLFGPTLKPLPAACLSMITGIFVVSFAPCFVQLMGLPISVAPVGIAIIVLTAICCIPLLLHFKKPVFVKPPMPRYYEWPFIAVFTVLAFVSVWRCFYSPPYARDMLAGPELLAEYAVREHNMISSVFTVDLHTTNNYFKSPYVTCLQIEYKLLVHPFGELWLSALAVAFWVWQYALLRERIHSIIAGFLLLLFFAIPDVYGYSHIILYDFSNMIFFFAGYYFLARYMEQRRQGDFLFCAFMFAAATYIRTETLVLVALTLPLLLIFWIRQKMPLKEAFKLGSIFVILPAVFCFVCINVFVKNFVPIAFDMEGQMTSNIGNFSAFEDRLSDMTTLLIFSRAGLMVYGYFIFFFTALLLADLIVFRRFTKEGKVALYGIAVVYIGLPLLGYLLPLMDLENTTKRGIFKLLPLMLLYMSNSALLQRASARLMKVEENSAHPAKTAKIVKPANRRKTVVR